MKALHLPLTTMKELLKSLHWAKSYWVVTFGWFLTKFDLNFHQCFLETELQIDTVGISMRGQVLKKTSASWLSIGETTSWKSWFPAKLWIFENWVIFEHIFNFWTLKINLFSWFKLMKNSIMCSTMPDKISESLLFQKIYVTPIFDENKPPYNQL